MTQNQKSFLIFFAFLLLRCTCSQFYESEYTRITAVLTEVLYASSNETQQKNKSCVERIQFALHQFSITYPFTYPLLVNIIPLSCSETHAIFINEQSKEIFFTIRSPQLVKQVQHSQQTRTTDQSPTRFFEDYEDKFYQINQIINNEIVDFANSGFQTIFFGHSLGGTVTLLACTVNSWMNHCEIHNPYLDATMVNSLNFEIKSSEIGKKTLISFTEGDPISTLPPQFPLHTISSQIPNPFINNPNTPKLLAHSSLSLFAELFFNKSQKETVLKYVSPILSIDDDITALKQIYKSKFKSILQSMNLQSKYYITYWNTLFTIYCPPFRSCGTIFGPIMCKAGYVAQQSRCSICVQGTFSIKIGQETETCTDCPEGHYCQNNDKPPIPTPPGSYQPFSRQTIYFDCEPGTYNTEFAQTKCQSCPIGHYCPDIDKDPIPCPAGFFQPNVNKTSCLKCEAGTYAIKQGQKSCESCPVGSYCPSSEQLPIVCPSNTCCFNINSTNVEVCSDSSHAKLRFLEVKNSSKKKD